MFRLRPQHLCLLFRHLLRVLLLLLLVLVLLLLLSLPQEEAIHLPDLIQTPHSLPK